MLTAYPYNTHNKQLQKLNRTELLDNAPSQEQAQAKAQGWREGQGADSAGVGIQFLPRCRDGEFIWVDMTAPGEADFALLRERFGVNDMILEDVQNQEGRPKFHEYEDHLYVIFHAVRAKAPRPGLPFSVQLSEIDCLIGADYVVTVHNDEIPAFEDLCRRWEKHPALMHLGPAYLLYELMDEVLDDFFPLLDRLDDHIDDLEDQMLEGVQRSLTTDIFALKRALLQIRHIAGPTRDVVNTLLRHDAENGGRHFAYFQDLYDHAVRIVDTIDTFRDILSGALDVYLAAQGNRLNEIMKTMTAMSIILLVPNLMAAIYGMNFKHMPELERPNGYYVALSGMALAMALLAWNFKRKNWL